MLVNFNENRSVCWLGIYLAATQFLQVIFCTNKLKTLGLIPSRFSGMEAGAPVHRTRETAKLLKAVTPDFIPPNL